MDSILARIQTVADPRYAGAFGCELFKGDCQKLMRHLQKLTAERDEANKARRAAQELAERYQTERNMAGLQARRDVSEQMRNLTSERDELRKELDCAEEAAVLAANNLEVRRG